MKGKINTYILRRLRNGEGRKTEREREIQIDRQTEREGYLLVRSQEAMT